MRTFLLPVLLLSAALGQAGQTTVDLADGNRLSVDAVAPGIFHISLFRGTAPNRGLMERYGITRSDWPGIPATVTSASGVTVIHTDDAELAVFGEDGRLRLQDRHGRVLVDGMTPLGTRASGQRRAEWWPRVEALVKEYDRAKDRGPILGDAGENRTVATSQPAPNAAIGSGFGLRAKLADGERLYGAGTWSKQHIQLRGHTTYNWVRYQENEQPAPFLMSTAGWGVFLNTSWRHFFDMGHGVRDELLVWGPQGELDFFLLSGEGLPQLLDRYTQVTGRSMMLPAWAYGLTWINHINANQFQVFENAMRFRKLGIPCDGFGLEPGWMKKSYDFSTKKEWNDDRFFIPRWMQMEYAHPLNFIAALSRLGFKLHLWLCVEYDLTAEAERAAAKREGKAAPEGPEAWFSHLGRFVDDGVVAWKLDPARLVDTPSISRQYVNGANEYEMHNLNQSLLAKQMWEGHAAKTELRPMLQYCGGWAGSPRWTANTVGDIMGGPEGLAWMLNAGLSGSSNTSGDMFIEQPGGPEERWPAGASLHFNFLAPWSLLDGWGYSLEPWLAGEKMESMVREYARLRYRLLPYLYSAAHTAHTTGMPMMRALPLVFPDDARLADEVHQYMLGDSLLVTSFDTTMRLPAGRWIDYWTAREYQGPVEMQYSIPPGRGGGLFIRAGAIIPYGPDQDYVGQKAADELALHVYPERQSRFTLYEDDGRTLGYENGEAAQTEIKCRKQGRTTTLVIEPRQGQYTGMPTRRRFQVWLHGAKPQTVLVDGKPLPEGGAGWTFDRGVRATRLAVSEDPTRRAACHVQLKY